MKCALFLAPVIFLLGALCAPTLQAQTPSGPEKGQGQQLRKRDASCAKSDQGPGQRVGKGRCHECGQGRGQGVRKQDGTGPRAGTADCPKTPKVPAK